jgi:hypothetical protein
VDIPCRTPLILSMNKRVYDVKRNWPWTWTTLFVSPIVSNTITTKNKTAARSPLVRTSIMTLNQGGISWGI